MSSRSTSPYRFGDLLALARQSWIARLSAELAAAGYRDYRRSDAAAMRLLHRAPMAVGRLAAALGVTRQAARKVVTGLEQRGLAEANRDPHDARQLNVTLTPDGTAYAHAITAAIGRLDRDLAGRVTPAQLSAADTVLRAVLVDETARRRAGHLAPPPEPAG